MSRAEFTASFRDTPWTLRQIIGLDVRVGGNFARFHARQYAQVPYRAGSRVIISLVAAIVMIAIGWPSVPHSFLLVWGGCVLFTQGVAYVYDRNLFDVGDRSLSETEMRRHAVSAAAKGAILSGGLCLFVFAGNGAQLPTLWAALAFIIMAAAVSRYSAPLSAICFILSVCAGALIAALAMFEWTLAVLILFTAALSCMGVVEGARQALDVYATEQEMIEKSETVSMLLREFEDGQADWLWQIDTGRRLRAVSPRLAFAMGREIAEIEGQSLLQLISGDDWKTGKFPHSLHDLAKHLKAMESFSNLVVKATINGEVRWWEMSGTPMFDDHGTWTGFRGVGSDVTVQRESNEKIEYLARFDTLTQLPNRVQINESIAHALEYAAQWRGRCALLMIDLDRFKAINDSLGHLVGDKMLAQVASRLKPLMRDGELCGRLGGDEFAVVLRDASDRKRVDTLTKAIIAALSAPYYVDNHVLYVGASVGSCIGPRDGRKVEELLRNADLALYRSKDEGGGVHCEYEPSLHSLAEERRVLEFALRHALEKNEFVLHYQPVVNAQSEEIVSFEALIRWDSKDHGFVSPAKFIPLAEDTRLIVPIGTWVLQEACREAARNWPAHVKVNINVSPEQLVEPDFVGTVVRALAHSGLDAKRLEIEVTESIFMRDADVARRALEQCMDLGCSVALDDFGTGYSSLGYLRKLRFTTIKVDRSFVQGAAQNSPESLAIIRAVVAMAESLGMETTAEGVENDDEADMIRLMGCTKIQGFHFGRPMPAEDARKVAGREEKRKRA